MDIRVCVCVWGGVIMLERGFRWTHEYGKEKGCVSVDVRLEEGVWLGYWRSVWGWDHVEWVPGGRRAGIQHTCCLLHTHAVMCVTRVQECERASIIGATVPASLLYQLSFMQGILCRCWMIGTHIAYPKRAHLSIQIYNIRVNKPVQDTAYVLTRTCKPILCTCA